MGTASKKAKTSSSSSSSRDVQKFKDICEIAGIDFEATVGKFTSSELRKSRREKLLDIYEDVKNLTRAKRTKEADKPKQLLRKKCVQYFYGGLEETAFVKRKEEQREQLGDEAEEKTSPKRSSASKKKQKRI